MAKTLVVLVAGTLLTASTAVAAPHRGSFRRHCSPPRHHHYQGQHGYYRGHSGHRDAGWVAVGAAALGAVIGGLIGAAAN